MSQSVVTVLTDRCAGCQECLVRCPVEAIDLDPERYVVVVDEARCVACGQCERVCPFDAILVEGEPRVAPSAVLPELSPEEALGGLAEVRGGFATFEEVLREAERCLGCPDPTCVRGCPTHNDIPEFIAELRAGHLAGARAVLAAHSSLPEICSRVCDAAIQCEGSCSWRLAGSRPVAIHAIERYIADHAEPPRPHGGRAEGRVLVVGAGPAGLAAADVLSAAGVVVHVVDAAEQPGGLMRYGIPRFTLPGAVVDGVVERLRSQGVTFELGHRMGPADVVAASERWDAVVVAVGASEPLPVRAAGIETVGTQNALEEIWSRQVAIEEGAPSHRERVLVVGAGNTAMDVARLVRRRGGEAVCVDWMDRRFSLVRPDELHEAEAEGVQVRFGVTVASVERANGRVHVRLVRTRQERATERPRLTDEVVEELEVDRIVAALGYRVDPSWSEAVGGVPERKEPGELPSRRWLASGLFRAPRLRGMDVGILAWSRDRARRRAGAWRRRGVWAVGDVLVGPSTVVEAMAHGRRAAEEILSAAGRTAVLPSRRLAPPRVLVVFDSMGGHTRRAALGMAETLAHFSPRVRCVPADQVHTEDLVDCDLLVAAGWVDGAGVVAQRPSAQLRRLLAELPLNFRPPVGIVLTYAIDPGDALGEAAQLVADRGGHVAAMIALGPQTREGDERDFLEALGDAAWSDGALDELLDAIVAGADPGWLVGPRALLARRLARAIVERHSQGALVHESVVARRLEALAEDVRLLRQVPVPS